MIWISKDVLIILLSLQVRDKSVNDTDVANMILGRFKSCGIVVSYAEMARVAREEGRFSLAAQLLEHEVLVEDQVQMLLEMNETDKALDKATSSWDAQLGMSIHLPLFHPLFLPPCVLSLLSLSFFFNYIL